MTPLLKLGEGLIYMKVGTHAQEPLEEIIERKTKEIEQTGYALWGYGGNTCHPLNIVQPFARQYHRKGSVIYLCMQPMNSKHFAEKIRANEVSVDGITWQRIPSTVNVMGSRFALPIKNLRTEEFNLALAKTQVAIGNSTGKKGNRYVIGRVDKACLEVIEEGATEADEDSTRIGLIAEIIEPFAVFVR
ncbi:hypothetical protein L0244_08480 [bacterium]|nr:hypothetical protein [bacterium]